MGYTDRIQSFGASKTSSLLAAQVRPTRDRSREFERLNCCRSLYKVTIGAPQHSDRDLARAEPKLTQNRNPEFPSVYASWYLHIMGMQDLCSARPHDDASKQNVVDVVEIILML